MGNYRFKITDILTERRIDGHSEVHVSELETGVNFFIITPTRILDDRDMIRECCENYMNQLGIKRPKRVDVGDIL